MPAGRSFFGRCGASVDPTRSAIIAHSVHRRVIDDGSVVGIVNDRDVHIVHRAVVGEHPVVPISPHIADAHVSEPIVNSAVEADARSPVTAMPDIRTATPAPVTWSP